MLTIQSQSQARACIGTLFCNDLLAPDSRRAFTSASFPYSAAVMSGVYPLACSAQKDIIWRSDPHIVTGNEQEGSRRQLEGKSRTSCTLTRVSPVTESKSFNADMEPPRQAQWRQVRPKFCRKERRLG